MMEVTQLEFIPEDYLPTLYIWNWGSGVYGLTEDEEDAFLDLKQNDENDKLDGRRQLQRSSFGSMNDGHDYIKGVVYAEDDALERLRQSGYDSKYFINNLGTIFIMYMISVLFTFAIVFMRIFTKAFCKNSKRVKWIDNHFHKIFWNGIFRFFIEAYLDMLVASFINIETSKQNLFKGSTHKIFSDIVASITILYLLILPLHISYIVMTKSDDIRLERQLWHDDLMRHMILEGDKAA